MTSPRPETQAERAKRTLAPYQDLDTRSSHQSWRQDTEIFRYRDGSSFIRRWSVGGTLISQETRS